MQLLLYGTQHWAESRTGRMPNSVLLKTDELTIPHFPLRSFDRLAIPLTLFTSSFLLFLLLFVIFSIFWVSISVQIEDHIHKCKKKLELEGLECLDRGIKEFYRAGSATALPVALRTPVCEGKYIPCTGAEWLPSILMIKDR